MYVLTWKTKFFGKVFNFTNAEWLREIWRYQSYAKTHNYNVITPIAVTSLTVHTFSEFPCPCPCWCLSKSMSMSLSMSVHVHTMAMSMFVVEKVESAMKALALCKWNKSGMVSVITYSVQYIYCWKATRLGWSRNCTLLNMLWKYFFSCY